MNIVIGRARKSGRGDMHHDDETGSEMPERAFRILGVSVDLRAQTESFGRPRCVCQIAQDQDEPAESPCDAMFNA